MFDCLSTDEIESHPAFRVRVAGQAVLALERQHFTLPTKPWYPPAKFRDLEGVLENFAYLLVLVC